MSISDTTYHTCSLIFYSGGIIGQFPFYYGLVNARGFFSPYVLKDGRCTFCTKNPFVFGVDEVIDHIYITTDTADRVVKAEVSKTIISYCYVKNA